MKVYRNIFRKKIKLNTKISMYFGFTAILLTVMFFLMTNFVINTSFNKYKEERERIASHRIVDYLEKVLGENQKLDRQHFEQLKNMVEKNRYNLVIYGPDKELIWQLDKNYFENNKNHREKFFLDMKNKGYYLKKEPIVIDGHIKGYIDVFPVKKGFTPPEEVLFAMKLFRGMILTAVIGLTITIIIGILLSKQITKPILKIKNVTDILRNGELSARVDINTDTKELEDLNKSINHLAIALDEQQKLRRRLTSDISHELRTPLNVLQNQIEALMDGIWEPTPERLKICCEEINRLTELIKDLEKLTTIDEYKVEINKQKFNLNEVANSTIKQFESIFSEKNIICKLKSKETYFYYGDKDKLKQVFINLLSNSVKYTNENGKIDVELISEENDMVIIIKDNGVGIDKEDLPNIFERFYRADNSRSRKTGGVGLGLAIVKSIIEAHEGSIGIQSVRFKETKIIIKLPKKTAL